MIHFLTYQMQIDFNSKKKNRHSIFGKFLVSSGPNKLAARIFGAVGCSRLRAGSTSWSARGTGVDPTHPLTLTPTRTQNGPEWARKAQREPKTGQKWARKAQPEPKTGQKWARKAAAPLLEIYLFYNYFSRTSAMSLTNFRLILIFASCVVVGIRNILYE